eukprot:gene23209-30083_t
MQFDVVYTSWLSRAIETAWLVLNEMDLLWLPISKSWRLNERMYGALTGLSKSMIKELYGDKQFKQWRRSYITRPPPTSSFSRPYFSLRIFHSVDLPRQTRATQFPKTESLKDCMSRTIPYYTNVIVPNSIDKGKSVLIASSENAIRGLLIEFNFGSSPDLLFKPCDQDDFGEAGTDEDDCYLDGSNLGKSYKYNPIISFPDSM